MGIHGPPIKYLFLKGKVGIHWPTIQSEFLTGGWWDPRTVDLVLILKGKIRDPRTAKSIRDLKWWYKDPRTAKSAQIFRACRDSRIADLVRISRRECRDLRTTELVWILAFPFRKSDQIDWDWLGLPLVPVTAFEKRGSSLGSLYFFNGQTLNTIL